MGLMIFSILCVNYALEMQSADFVKAFLKTFHCEGHLGIVPVPIAANGTRS
jgi:hypothetical protein